MCKNQIYQRDLKKKTSRCEVKRVKECSNDLQGVQEKTVGVGWQLAASGCYKVAISSRSRQYTFRAVSHKTRRQGIL